MSSVAVQAIGVGKKFGENVALNNINLSIQAGQFFSLLGPSGCGKTTLLRMIAGFERPDSGQLLVDGQDVVKTPPHKRAVNMVFQNYALFPHMDVVQNIAFGLHCKGGLSKAEISAKVQEGLELVRLASLADRFPSQLSGGQQQRIALARAIVNRPKVLLLDEPLSALDPQIREEMQAELARLQRELGLTFVMVTHDQSEALALSHQIAVFSRGNIEQIGRPEEIYQAPESLFVAKFIGQTNLLTGTLISFDDQLVTIKLAEGTAVSARRNSTRNSTKENALAVGQAISVWVKPHSISLSQIDRAAGKGTNESKMPNEGTIGGEEKINQLEALVVAVNYQGFLTEYILQESGGERLRAVRVNASSNEHNGVPLACAPGDKVLCCFSSSDCSFFSHSQEPVPSVVGAGKS